MSRKVERYKPQRVMIESVAAQEYLAQDVEKFAAVDRVERTKDKVSRAYWLQALFENAQVLFPAKHLQARPELWQTMEEELILFPSADHDDLFDGLETMMQGAIGDRSQFGIWFIGSDEPETYNPRPWARAATSWSSMPTWASGGRRWGGIGHIAIQRNAFSRLSACSCCHKRCWGTASTNSDFSQ